MNNVILYIILACFVILHNNIEVYVIIDCYGGEADMTLAELKDWTWETAGTFDWYPSKKGYGYAGW